MSNAYSTCTGAWVCLVLTALVLCVILLLLLLVVQFNPLDNLALEDDTVLLQLPHWE